jgi:hypothetical protein
MRAPRLSLLPPSPTASWVPHISDPVPPAPARNRARGPRVPQPEHGRGATRWSGLGPTPAPRCVASSPPDPPASLFSSLPRRPGRFQKPSTVVPFSPFCPSLFFCPRPTHLPHPPCCWRRRHHSRAPSRSPLGRITLQHRQPPPL